VDSRSKKLWQLLRRIKWRKVLEIVNVISEVSSRPAIAPDEARPIPHEGLANGRKYDFPARERTRSQGDNPGERGSSAGRESEPGSGTEDY
jgi:hypothetical protein